MAYDSRRFGSLFLLLSLYVTYSSSKSEVYIVYLGSKIHDDPRLTSNHHLQLLSNVFSSEKEAKLSIVYHYKHSFSGFSVMLNSSQASELAERKEVISVFKSKTLESRTTRSWDFLGLTIDSRHHHDDDRAIQLKYGDDIVVGVIDSGVWPESESFREEASMKEVPRSWRGICQKGEMFDPRKHCNKKLIGARYYPNAYEAAGFGPVSCLNSTTAATECRSARDFVGHGTHTASTAVGSVVKVASGLGKGVARGGAPRARLAVYKACWLNTLTGFDQVCLEADVLKAFDHALRDGVHVISVSLGSGPPLRDFFNWSASIGSFHAHQLGVTVVFAAGNDGPTHGTVENVMPWAISVAASTIDRTFPTSIVAPGHNLSLLGQSFNFGEKPVLKAQLGLAEDYFRSGVCEKESLKPDISAKSGASKVLLCFRWKGQVGPAATAASENGFAALIFAEPIPKPDSSTQFPVVWLEDSQGLLLRRLARTHIQSSLHLLVGPTRTAASASSVAPAVSYFSSRGPNSADPDILKPDVAAPGINILAAWPPLNADGLPLKWNFQSGTSMACPHVAGVAALLKSAHPDWSPSAIRSALATTASVLDSSGSRIVSDDSNMPSDPLAYGAGHVDPLRAMDPGLVYDMTTADHVAFLCNQGYTREQLEIILLPCSLPASCDRRRPTTSGLNYPSISVSDLHSPVTVRRTVRNVGPSKVAVYASSVVEPDGVEVTVWPRVLVFWWFREEITYSVTLTPKKKSRGIYDFGEIVWTNTFGAHKVRTPLVVQVNTIFPNNTFVDDDRDHDRHLLTQPA